MKLLTIIGARPQFIKAAVLSSKFKKYHDIEEIIIHTGQHFDQNMSNIFFEEMNITKPHYNLEINGLDHGEMTGKMLIEIEKLTKIEKPDWIMVYGDTNSTLAGALIASKLHIKLIHVEAGLRSFNMKMPEEINRILTDQVSNLLFCSTKTALNNLKKENITSLENFKRKAIIVGDIMEESFNMFSKSNKNLQKIEDNYVLATLHRAENTDNSKKLKGYIDQLNKIHNEIKVILPLHPRTKNAIEKNNIQLNCKIIDPVGYIEMINLIKNSQLIITDSGGLQKEAYFARKYCITMRDQTEWVELIENNLNYLVSWDKNELYSKFKELEGQDYPKNINNLYGDGMISEKIVNEILKY